eukprot:232740-Chlamydomonas_euryale.AAC.3
MPAGIALLFTAAYGTGATRAVAWRKLPSSSRTSKAHLRNVSNDLVGGSSEARRGGSWLCMGCRGRAASARIGQEGHVDACESV